MTTDHFRRIAQAFPCQDKSATRVARVLRERYFCVFGFQERIHSDQGANFESQLIGELIRVSGVNKSHNSLKKQECRVINRTLGGVTSYDQNVASLTNTLNEAMVIAQHHAIKERNSHACLYNGKVKGSKIEISYSQWTLKENSRMDYTAVCTKSVTSGC